MASVERRGGGWRVRWRDPDGQPRSRQCPTKKAADKLALDVSVATSLGKRWQPESVRAVTDLEVMARAWLDELARLRSSNTVTGAASVLARFIDWARSQGKDDASVLTREMVSRWYADQTAAESARQVYVRVLMRWWSWLYDHEVYGDDVGRPRRLEMRAVVQPITRAPTWEQMDAAIRAAGPEQVRRLLLLLRCTGLRVGQGLGLEWRDVNLEERRLIIRPELGKSAAERSGRIIPISGVLTGEMKGWGERTGRIVPITRPGKHLVAAWRDSGAPPDVWQKRSAHAMRKGFVSGLRRAGADPDAIEYLVGHSSGIRGVYIDPSALPLREAVDLVPALSNVDTIGTRTGHNRPQQAGSGRNAN